MFKIFNMPALLTSLVLFLQAHTVLAIQPEQRMAIEIGSNNTRYTIAQVNPQTHKIVNIVDSGSFEAAFQIDLIISKDRRFSPQMFTRAIDIFQRLKAKQNYYGVARVRTIAKQTFRNASNSRQLSDLIQEKTKIVVHTLPIEEEDQLDYFTAMRASQSDSRPVVWDIASDSFQLITKDNEQEPFTHQGKQGSMTFMDYLLEVVQKKQGGNLRPMSAQQIEAGLQFARYLGGQVPKFLAQSIRETDGNVLVIGSLFRNSISGSIANGQARIPASLLRQYLDQQADKSHSTDSNQRYDDMDLSNAIMVYGLMQALKIDNLQVASRDTTESILEYAPFWQ